MYSRDYEIQKNWTIFKQDSAMEAYTAVRKQVSSVFLHSLKPKDADITTVLIHVVDMASQTNNSLYTQPQHCIYVRTQNRAKLSASNPHGTSSCYLKAISRKKEFDQLHNRRASQLWLMCCIDDCYR